jgi:hypothetical protein
VSYVPTWEPGRWFCVLGPDGDPWCATSDRDEAVRSMRPGDRLYQQWTYTEHELREEQP